MRKGMRKEERIVKGKRHQPNSNLLSLPPHTVFGLNPFPVLPDVRQVATSRAPRSEFRETTPGFLVRTT